MGKYNKILVAMDGSEESKNALRQAFKLAFDEKRWITVVSINPPYQGDLYLVGVSNINEILKGPGEKILSEAQKIADEEKATIKTRLEEGDPFKKIIEIAEEEHCDLIIMGRRGMSHFERALMGGVTAKVIGHFKGKTLVIPRNSSIGWKNILVATDGSKYSEAAIEESINYAKSYNGSLNVVTAVDVTEEFEVNVPDLVDKLIEKAKSTLNEIKKKAQDAGVNTEVMVRQGEPYRVIIDLAKQVNADIIIMGSHGRTGLTRLFMGSVTSRVIGHTPYPVMIVNK